jgi:hypothetical protein
MMFIPSKRRTQGLAMVELAIVLPLVMLLIMATAEFGRAFWQYNTLTKTVRDGARHAASGGMLGSSGVVIVTPALRSQVQNLVVHGNLAGIGPPLIDGLNRGNVSLENPGGGDVLVRATYSYNPIFGFVPDFDGSGWSPFYEFEAVVRMRAL